MDWYLYKAAAWVESNGGGWRAIVDRTKPPTRKLSTDKRGVEVVFPTGDTNMTVVVRLDVHTGKVQESAKVFGGIF